MTEHRPPYLSIVRDDDDTPILLLTVDPDACHICEHCPHVHVQLFNDEATPAMLRRVAEDLRTWANSLERVS